MTQQELDLPLMHAVSLFTVLDGKLAQWEAITPDINAALGAVAAELAAYKGPRRPVLALVRNNDAPMPVVATSK